MKTTPYLISALCLFLVFESSKATKPNLEIGWANKMDKKMKHEILNIVQKAYWKYFDEKSIAWYTTASLYGSYPPKNNKNWNCSFKSKIPILATKQFIAIIDKKTRNVLTCIMK